MLTNEELMAINGYSEDDLEHYGILGMKWGIRRYENPDGSLTEAGKRRYAKYERKKQRVMQSGDAKKILKFRKNLTDEEFDTAMARVAKTDALRYNANAAKREKQEARAAEKAEKKQAKEQRKAEKLSEKQAKEANKVIKEQSKERAEALKQANKKSFIESGLAITGTIIAMYTNYKKIAGMVKDISGYDMPFTGSKDMSKVKPPEPTKKYSTDTIDIDKDSWSNLTDMSKSLSEKISSKNTNNKVTISPSASDPRVDINTKSINSFFNTANTAKASQNTDRINSFFNSVSSGKKTTNEILSGKVEGVGNSFKSLGYKEWAGRSRETFTKGSDIVQPLLGLPYDPNKKF